MELTLAYSEGYIVGASELPLPWICCNAPWDLEEVIWTLASPCV